jgi:hypothetical protein
MRTIWQVGSGDANRPYFDEFIRYGVALIGPGSPGPWKPGGSDEDYEGPWARRLAVEAQDGDAIVLRSGTSRIKAVGIIAGEYLYLEQFDDVNGWDLQHARRVRWFPLPNDQDFGASVFGFGQRFSRTANPAVVDFVERLLNSPPTAWQSASLPPLPEVEPALEPIPGEFLELVGRVGDLVPLYWDTQRFGSRPTEDELVAHITVPFLEALGWPTECIAIKWDYVDIVVFRRLPRVPENIAFIVEAKRVGQGVEGALGQAMEYLRSLGVSVDIVVTDGIRYRLFSPSTDDGFQPTAYANLHWPKQPALGLFERLKRN